MGSGTIVALELVAVLGTVLGLAGWELWRLRRGRSVDDSAVEVLSEQSGDRPGRH